MRKLTLAFYDGSTHDQNSAIERFHSALLKLFRALALENDEFIVDNMNRVIIGYNFSVRTITKFRPVDVIYCDIDRQDPSHVDLHEYFLYTYIEVHQTKQLPKNHIKSKKKDKHSQRKLVRPRSIHCKSTCIHPSRKPHRKSQTWFTHEHALKNNDKTLPTTSGNYWNKKPRIVTETLLFQDIPDTSSRLIPFPRSTYTQWIKIPTSFPTNKPSGRVKAGSHIMEEMLQM